MSGIIKSTLKGILFLILLPLGLAIAVSISCIIVGSIIQIEILSQPILPRWIGIILGIIVLILSGYLMGTGMEDEEAQE